MLQLCHMRGMLQSLLLVPYELGVRCMLWLLLLLRQRRLRQRRLWLLLPVLQIISLHTHTSPSLLLQQVVGQLIDRCKAHCGRKHSRCDTVVCLGAEPRCCKTCKQHQNSTHGLSACSCSGADATKFGALRLTREIAFLTVPSFSKAVSHISGTRESVCLRQQPSFTFTWAGLQHHGCQRLLLPAQ
jgi:hypothetical protein